MNFAVDRLVLTPDDIDLSRSPLAGRLDAETYVLGAFNPGLTRLPNGNLLMMVRVAEALRRSVREALLFACLRLSRRGSCVPMSYRNPWLTMRVSAFPKSCASTRGSASVRSARRFAGHVPARYPHAVSCPFAALLAHACVIAPRANYVSKRTAGTRLGLSAALLASRRLTRR